MSESKKNKIRISTFIIGGVLTITGIMCGSYALIQIRDGASIYMPYILILISTLPAGIYLCFGPIKLPHYFKKSKKKSGEEKAIEFVKHIVQRKSETAILTILLVLMLAAFIWIVSILNEATQTMTSENIRVLAVAILIYFCFAIGAVTGIVMHALTDEISGDKRNKHMLTLNMWERIQDLEDEVRELKSSTQEDGQQADEMGSGDSKSGSG